MCVADGYLNIAGAVEKVYAENRGAYTKGDGNGDGYIAAIDYQITKWIVLGSYTPSAVQVAALDVNGDGDISAADYLMISRYIYRTYYFIP